MESLICVLERELAVFGRGDRPDYDVILAVIDYFKDYPGSCHHPKEDLVMEMEEEADAERASASSSDRAAPHSGVHSAARG